MITVVDKDIIPRLHLVQGWSERRIARELGFARDTVRKYLREDSDTAPRYRLTKPRAKPVMDAVLPLPESKLFPVWPRPGRSATATKPKCGQILLAS